MFSKKPNVRAERRRARPAVESLEDRFVPANVLADYAVVYSWNTGFQAEVELTNQDPNTIQDWTLEFDFAADISSIWNAKIVSHVGDHYIVTGASWNQDLSANGVTSFGFIAGSDSAAEFTNLIINGEPLDGVVDPAPTPPTLTAADVSAYEASGVAQFVLELSQASDSPVTVDFATRNGTAEAGSDYLSATGTVTFAAGQTSAVISVDLIDDVLVEADETFALDLFGVDGAVLAATSATASIFSDDVAPPEPPSGNVTFSIDSDWGSGFTGQITVVNDGDETLQNWTLEFDFAGNISSIWNAEIVSRTGNHYVITHTGWNSMIGIGGSINFGFVASPSGGTVSPTNFTLDGTPITDPNPTPDPDPEPSPVLQANDDYRHAVADQSAVIKVLANDDGDPTVSNVTQPQHGTAVVNPDGTITYTPNAGYVGVDSFEYSVTNADLDSSTARVQITISDTASVWPESVFAPYVDMLLYPTYDLTAAVDQGIQFFTLAFISASPSGQAAWGGYEV